MTGANRSGLRRLVAVAGAAALLLAACGGDDDAEGDDPPAASADADAGGDDAGGDTDADVDTDADAGDDSDAGADANADSGNSGGGDGGELVFDGETIALDRPLCYLQEQDAAAGGGKILLNAQAEGTMADGELIDVSFVRWDEDSQFHGDDVIIGIGDYTTAAYVSLIGGGEIGVVAVDGSTLTANDLAFDDFETGTEHTASFVINC